MIELSKSIYLGSATPGSGGAVINNQDITVTVNDIYTASSGYTGLGTVTVNVPNGTETLSVTENGTYTPTSPNIGFSSVDVNVASSGDEIEVLNLTGNTLSVGDKAWLSPMYLGNSADVETVSTNGQQHPAFVSRDGTLVYFPYDGILYDVTGQTSTSVTANQYLSSPVVKYADNGITFAYTNSPYNTSYPDWVIVGGGAYGTATSYAYCGDNYFYDAAISVFIKMYAGTMNLDKTYTNNLSIYNGSQAYLTGQTFCYYNGYLYYKSSGNVITQASVDDENLTITSTGVTSSLETIYDIIPWVTKDGRYFIGCVTYTGTGYEYVRKLKIYTNNNGVLTKMIDVSSLSEDLAAYYDISKYIVCYNQQDDILTLFDTINYTIIVFKYSDNKFIKLSTYTGTYTASDVEGATSDASGTVMAYNPNGGYGYIIQVQGDSEYKAINYQNINVSQDSLTGYVTEGGASGATVKVATVMPQQLNVSVTVNANNAEISGGIE